MRNLIIVLAVMLVLLGGLWLAFDREVGEQEIPISGAEPVPVPDSRSAVPASRPSATPAAEAEIVLPELDASDPFLRERLAGADVPEGWLDREDLVRRLAVAIENAGRGEYPRRQLGFLAPLGKFQVVEREGRLFADPSNYRRFDKHIDVLEGMDPETAAELLILIEPLLTVAMRELGSDASVSGQIDAAIAEVMAVPEIDGQVELVRPKVLYEYADPALEALSPLQKQVLRLGPDNVARLKRYLDEVGRALQGDASDG